jgi:small-conductance mechanosensitive channel/CRP-like cAMP-binding protein
MLQRLWEAVSDGEGGTVMAVVVVLGLALAFALRAAVARDLRPRLRAPSLLLMAAALLWAGLWLFLPGTQSAWRFGPLLLVLLAFGRLASVALFDWVLSSRLKRDPPRIVRDICEGVIAIVALLALLRAAGVEALPLLTTSAVFTAIIGLSLQDTLGNLLAGLVLQTQRPFELGEWIQLDKEGLQLGRVIGLDWRATKLLTTDNKELNVPNSQLVRAPILNLSRPVQTFRRALELALPYEAPIERVRAALERTCWGVPGILPHPKPEVVTSGFSDFGLRYQLRYSFDDPSQRDAIEARLRERVWYALQRSGVAFARAPGVPVGAMQPGLDAKNLETRTRAIRGVDFLRDLPDSAIALMASDARTELYAPGELVVRQGEAGGEPYLCVSGELRVLYTADDGTEHEMARIGPGGLFGEFAQLTGETRTASVQAESACELVAIDKTAFSSVLRTNPALAEQISERLAERRAELEAAAANVSVERASIDEHKGRFLQRLRDWLDL